MDGEGLRAGPDSSRLIIVHVSDAYAEGDWCKSRSPFFLFAEGRRDVSDGLPGMPQQDKTLQIIVQMIDFARQMI